MGNALDKVLSAAGETIGFLERVRTASGVLRGGPMGPNTFLRPRARVFRVVEAIEESGEHAWVVTDGHDRAVCTSPEFARRVKVALG